MVRQSTTGEESKKRRHHAPDVLKTGSEELNPTDTPQDDEIDPAEFFDPEEFGIRRNFHPHA
jgi:hypothetical protein